MLTPFLQTPPLIMLIQHITLSGSPAHIQAENKQQQCRGRYDMERALGWLKKRILT